MSQQAQQGLTTVELVVAAGLFVLLAASFASVINSMQDQAVNIAVDLDMSKAGSRQLMAMRGEIRQSGHDDITAADMVSEPADGSSGDTLSFRKRTNIILWSEIITFRITADGTFRDIEQTPRYRLERVEDGVVTVMAADVASLEFERPLLSDTVVVRLELARAVKGELLTRRFEDTILLQNGGPE